MVFVIYALQCVRYGTLSNYFSHPHSKKGKPMKLTLISKGTFNASAAAVTCCLIGPYSRMGY